MLWCDQDLHLLPLEHREHLIEPGGGRAAGSERLLETGDQIAFAVALHRVDHRSRYFGDLRHRRTFEVGIDCPGDRIAQNSA
jgi:hypothetical protein